MFTLCPKFDKLGLSKGEKKMMTLWQNFGTFKKKWTSIIIKTLEFGITIEHPKQLKLHYYVYMLKSLVIA